MIQNQPKLLNNKSYELKDESIDDYARKKLGKILTLNKLNLIENEIEDILVNQNSYSQEIDNFFEKYFY